MKKTLSLTAALALGGAAYVAWLQQQPNVTVTDAPDAGAVSAVVCPDGQIPCLKTGWECVPPDECVSVTR